MMPVIEPDKCTICEAPVVDESGCASFHSSAEAKIPIITVATAIARAINLFFTY